MMRKFIKLYTPFIFAVIALIHGVLFLTGNNCKEFISINEFSGHSIIALWYIWIHSKRMCKWYKRSLIMLFSIHFLNIIYYLTGIIPIWIILYGGVILNIISMICWIVFITTPNITKIIHSACKHSEKE